MSPRARGLTLLEMVLVVVVLMILAGLLFGAWTAVDYRTRMSLTESRLEAIGFAIREHSIRSGFPPAGLSQVVSAVGHPEWIQGGSFVDGWERPFRYAVSDRQFRLWSLGPDGKDGTEDDVHYNQH